VWRRQKGRKAHATRPADVQADRLEICRLFQGDHSLAYCDGVEWKMPDPETWEAIRKAAKTAGTLMNLRN
jgi:hypothetical protein